MIADALATCERLLSLITFEAWDSSPLRSDLVCVVLVEGHSDKVGPFHFAIVRGPLGCVTPTTVRRLGQAMPSHTRLQGGQWWQSQREYDLSREAALPMAFPTVASWLAWTKVKLAVIVVLLRVE